MKNLYITAVLIAGSLAATAQDFIYPVGQNLVETVVSENFQEGLININTPSFEAIQYDWELVSNTFPAAWSYSLCDYGGCEIGIPPTGSMTPITLTEAESGIIGWFKMNLTVGQNSGTGKAELYVYDSNDYSRGDIVSWEYTWDAATASLTINMNDGFSVSPNPVSNQLTITAQGVNTGAIYNGVGQKVRSLEFTNEHTLDVSDLKGGVYIVVLETETGTISERLIVE
ncbi:MAG: T9SS type A sorting domain-containing protein [Crocinitomicaceae bacterium]|nr:T9SS type A sorting domain-containing protein [Flavobacteriales bacterium]NQZ34990.1 T9SS type A sorting domain-containing protein [Crocinitomicaceae bacterium]